MNAQRFLERNAPRFAEEKSGHAQFARRKDSKNPGFEIMDFEGRGNKGGAFWAVQTREVIIGYSKWLVKKKNIFNRTDFSHLAPSYVVGFVRRHDLWDELGVKDCRSDFKFQKKSAGAKPKKEEISKGPAPKKPVEKRPGFDIFKRNTEKEDPYAPLASLSASRIPFSPAKITPPLPEPKYRLWRNVSKEEREKMADELLEAARKGEMYCLKKLLSMGVPVDARNKRGETALMEAALWWHKNMCRYLLDMGANPRARNTHGENALSYAKDGEDRETIELIRKAIKKRK